MSDNEGPVRLNERLALTTSEVARALGVSERTVRNCISEIPHFRLGTKPLFGVDSLRAHIVAVSRTEAKTAKLADEIMDDLDPG